MWSITSNSVSLRAPIHLAGDDLNGRSVSPHLTMAPAPIEVGIDLYRGKGVVGSLQFRVLALSSTGEPLPHSVPVSIDSDLY